MKILIVSGFLGAGKTTFIKRLARNVDQRFAILENEYGAAGIDGARLGQNRQGTQKNVWEMTEQCICCIGKKDFAASVLTIANVVDPEYLIVEPTGVGSLARIIENLRQIEYERIQLLSPVTIVDVYSYRRYMAESRAVSGSDPKRGYDHCFQNRSMPGGRKTAHPEISAGN